MKFPLLIACLVFAIPILAFAADDDHAPASGDADVTLDNHWGIPLDLYIDRKFGCSAPNYGTCTARVDSGVHELQARDGDEVVAREFVTLRPGDDFSYHVEKGKSPNL